MTHESLVNRDWRSLVDRLGGAVELGVSAKETKAFVRPREIKTAVDLLRMIPRLRGGRLWRIVWVRVA